MPTLKDFDYFGLTPIERLALAKELLESVMAGFETDSTAVAGRPEADTPQTPRVLEDGGQ